MSSNTVHPQVDLKDVFIASVLSNASAIANVLPQRFNFIQKSDAPSYTPVRWRRLPEAAAEIDTAWLNFAGSKGSGRTPRNYGQVAIILVDREEMDSFKASKGESRHAVVYKLGTAAMMGSSSKYKILGLESQNDSDYKFALRVGSQPLVAGVGLDVPCRNSSFGRSIPKYSFIYKGLVPGVRPGPAIAEIDLPPTIPLL